MKPIKEDDPNKTKRSRITRACDACRRRKIRCNAAGNEKCSNCHLYGLDCTFTTLAKKRGPPKGYMDALEARIKRMEKLINQEDSADSIPSDMSAADLEKIRSEFGLGDNIHDGSLNELRKNLTDGSTSYPIKSKTSSEPKNDDKDISQDYTKDGTSLQSGDCDADEEDGLASELEEMNLEEGVVRYIDSGNEILSRFLGGTDKKGVLELPLPSREGGKLYIRRITENNFVIIEEPPEISYDEYRNELPPREISDVLIEAYFEHIHPYMPIISKPRFLKQYRGELTSPTPFLMNAIFSLTVRAVFKGGLFNRYPMLSEGMADVFYQRVKKLLDTAFEKPQLSTVQALLLLTIDTQLANNPENNYLYSSLAVRIAQELGMHRDSSKWKISRSESELRKRIWWICYVFDREISSASGRPLLIHDSHCDVDLVGEEEPDDDEFLASGMNTPKDNKSTSSSPTKATRRNLPMTFLNQLVRLYQILTRIIQTLYSPSSRRIMDYGPRELLLREHADALIQWYSTIPSELRFSLVNAEPHQGVSPWAELLQIYYCKTIIQLHHSFMVRGDKGKNTFLVGSLNASSAAANAAMEALESLIKKGFPYPILMINHVFGLLYFVFLSNMTSGDEYHMPVAKANMLKLILFSMHFECTCMKDELIVFFKISLGVNNISFDKEMVGKITREVESHLGPIDYDLSWIYDTSDPKAFLEKALREQKERKEREKSSSSEEIRSPPRKRAHQRDHDEGTLKTGQFTPIQLDAVQSSSSDLSPHSSITDFNASKLSPFSLFHDTTQQRVSDGSPGSTAFSTTISPLNHQHFPGSHYSYSADPGIIQPESALTSATMERLGMLMFPTVDSAISMAPSLQPTSTPSTHATPATQWVNPLFPRYDADIPGTIASTNFDLWDPYNSTFRQYLQQQQQRQQPQPLQKPHQQRQESQPKLNED
ncbi:uncharacterized protein VTP21DRAFT_8384 [Calcarisporiella thermophila]|uniref:uncharacterized protein n=1 Tax=Calcarisporiella thermophila TaxID=911321 RepID=UPI003743B55F